MSSIRVLHVLNELKFSGAEIMLKTALPFWKEQDIHGEILAKGGKEGPYRSVLEESGYNVFHIPHQGTFSFLQKYRRFLSERKYDVVHIHTEGLNFLLGLAAVIEGIPVVVRTVHSTFLHGGKTRLKRVTQRALLRMIGVEHVSIGRSVEEVEREFLYNNTHLISNWYDDNKFVPPDTYDCRRARQKFGVSDEEFVIVSVGNCHKVKNHAAIFRALSRLEDERIIYLHAGEEQEGHPERRLASELGIQEQVQFLGLVEEVQHVLYASDAYIMPSLREGANIAVREAMGSGLICVLSEVPGLRDHKELDGVFMTRPRPDPLSSTIERVLSIPEEERLRLGRKLSKQAKERYGIRQGARQYAELYRQELS